GWTHPPRNDPDRCRDPGRWRAPTPRPPQFRSPSAPGRTGWPKAPAAMPASSGHLVIADEIAIWQALADAHEHMLGEPVMLADAGLEGGRGAQVIFRMRHRFAA